MKHINFRKLKLSGKNNGGKLPPYSHVLLEKISNKNLSKNDIFLFVGHRAWQSAKAFSLSQTVLLLPPGESPYEYQWPVINRPVLLINTGNVSEHLIKQTAHALLSSGAEIVRVIEKTTGSLTIFRR